MLRPVGTEFPITWIETASLDAGDRVTAIYKVIAHTLCGHEYGPATLQEQIQMVRIDKVEHPTGYANGQFTYAADEVAKENG